MTWGTYRCPYYKAGVSLEWYGDDVPTLKGHWTLYVCFGRRIFYVGRHV